MRNHWTLFALGLFIFFLPFLGFPLAWKTAFLLVSGGVICTIALSFIIEERKSRMSNDEENTSKELS